MDSNQCQDHTSIDGTDGSGCIYSSHSTLPPCSEHSHDIPSHHGTSHPFLSSTPPQSNQEQPAARSSLPPDDTQLSTSSSPAASYPEAPSSVSGTLIGIIAGNEQDQNPWKVGRLLSESESDSDCESGAGMEGEGEGGLCQECYKNSALFAQFLSTSLTYVLLSYFIRLHCANIHTPLPLIAYLYDFQTRKTRHQNPLG